MMFDSKGMTHETLDRQGQVHLLSATAYSFDALLTMGTVRPRFGLESP